MILKKYYNMILLFFNYDIYLKDISNVFFRDI